MRLIALACAVPSIAVLLLACSAEPVGAGNDGGSAQKTAAGDMVCKREYPTGSNLPVTKCRSRKQIEAEQAAANEALQRSTIGGSVRSSR